MAELSVTRRNSSLYTPLSITKENILRFVVTVGGELHKLCFVRRFGVRQFSKMDRQRQVLDILGTSQERNKRSREDCRPLFTFEN